MLAGCRVGRGRRDGSETFLCALARSVNDCRESTSDQGGSGSFEALGLDENGLAWWVVWNWIDMSEAGATLNHAAFPVGVASGERGDLVGEILINEYF